ncbi:MAG: bifunctional diaminohydroxyphosphoribosylaminopyrimidine deaminase/5-amino-6-(5-phosphoribosylamino)uracil reductase RibD [Saprospiraceae bacterium]
MTTHERYISRCFELARRGSGLTRSNPLVGAVLVHNGEIIGEGWHQKYGGPHAEVNAFDSVKPQDKHRIPDATLYCNLEPCFHFGKTPPCVDLVIKNQIKTLVIANTDPNPLVAGKSIERLRGLGVHVLTDVLQEEGEWLNRVFLKHIHTQQPYIILKWAESADGFISKTGEQTAISAPATNRLTHTWRSETGAILVGTHCNHRQP